MDVQNWGEQDGLGSYGEGHKSKMAVITWRRLK